VAEDTPGSGRPKIGITCSPLRRPGYYAAYFHAIEAAGGEPVSIEPWDTAEPERPHAVLRGVDGLLLPGGWDIDPPAYGEQRVIPETEEVDRALDSTERALVLAAVDDGVPLFGICRGVQSINVALGGSLHQHIDGHDMHGQPRHAVTHSIDIDTGSELADVVHASTLMVNSLHHQAVKKVAPPLRVTARSNDSTVEAVESAERMIVAVQCHPEELVDQQAWALALLQQFVDRARATASARIPARKAPAGTV